MTRQEEREERARHAAEQEDAWINRYARPLNARYEMFCGKCRAGAVVEAADLPDGEVWLCSKCRPA